MSVKEVLMKERESLTKIVYNYISDEIQKGNLNPGEKLSETRICDALKISRTPIREALIKLASENLLVHSPRRGFSVKKVTIQTKIDTYVVISNLDALAAVLSMDYINEDDLLIMEEIIDMISIAIKYKNMEKYSKLQGDFHEVYVNKCNNSVLISTLQRLKNSFVQIIYKNNGSENHYEIFKEINDEHKKIIELFRKKDKEGLYSFLVNIHWATKYEDMI
jgi:DNA-binding GntR family transcriptional regulator